LFGEWKKESRLVVLSSFYAKRYSMSSLFRNRILTLINNPLEQLILQFDTVSYRFEIDVRNLSGILQFKAEASTIAVIPSRIHEVSLIGCTIGTLMDCPPIRSLTIVDCNQMDSDHYDSCIDAACFTILEEAFFESVQYSMIINNYPTLGHLKTLSISNCDSITDVSCFRNVQKLSLNSCANITDVSSLGNVRELTLTYCSGITDVSSLGKIYQLSLKGCDNISDISTLGNVHSLNLSYCPLVSDISSLKNVYELELCEFNGTGFAGLEKIEKLVFNSPSITDIGKLTTLKELDIFGESAFSHFYGVPGLFKLTLGYVDMYSNRFRIDSGEEVFHRLVDFTATGVTLTQKEETIRSYPNYLYWNHLGNLHSLTLISCSVDQIPESFPRLRSLTMTDCNDLSFLPVLPSLGYLEINSCLGLKTLHLQHIAENKFPLYYLKIEYCLKLNKVKVSHRISQAEILRCPELSYLIVQCPVTTLKLKGCDKLRNICLSAPIGHFECLDKEYLADDYPND
jgi:Leucine-rich repeat (LRR) protein